jgi:hypothetical protein
VTAVSYTRRAHGAKIIGGRPVCDRSPPDYPIRLIAQLSRIAA